jgi:phosphoglycolate phosphatase
MTPPPELLFDLDDCIVDSFPSIARCWAETLPDFGFPAPDLNELLPLLGPPSDVVARHFARGASEDTVAGVVAAYRKRSTLATDVEAFDGMPEVLGELSGRGVRLALSTSKSIEVAEPLLDRLKLRCWFDVVEGTHLDELGADKTKVVGRTLRALSHCRPLALVGDREHDVRAAHAHGIQAIGALWGYGTRDELIGAGADVLANEPAEIAALVDQIG